MAPSADPPYFCRCRAALALALGSQPLPSMASSSTRRRTPPAAPGAYRVATEVPRANSLPTSCADGIDRLPGWFGRRSRPEADHLQVSLCGRWWSAEWARPRPDPEPALRRRGAADSALCWSRRSDRRRSGGPSDLIAVSREFDADLVCAAYRSGVFPMPVRRGVMGWFSPLRRGVLPLDGLRVSRSLRKMLGRYRISVDVAFDARAGRAVPIAADPAPGSTTRIRRVYRELHRAGVVHSLEAWTAEGRLAGGLYGVSVGGLFAGESMFHDPEIGRDASKVALVALVERLRAAGRRPAARRPVADAAPGLARCGRDQPPDVSAATRGGPDVARRRTGAADNGLMPEMPEVESLARFLTEKCVGHAIARIELTAFSALKTYDPPLSALHGLEIEAVTRHGKFLDISAQGLHLVFHLARAGWLRWKDAAAGGSGQAGAGPAGPAAPAGRRLRLRPHRGRHPAQTRRLRGDRPGVDPACRHARPRSAVRGVRRGRAGRRCCSGPAGPSSRGC